MSIIICEQTCQCPCQRTIFSLVSIQTCELLVSIVLIRPMFAIFSLYRDRHCSAVSTHLSNRIFITRAELRRSAKREARLISTAWYFGNTAPKKRRSSGLHCVRVNRPENRTKVLSHPKLQFGKCHVMPRSSK